MMEHTADLEKKMNFTPFFESGSGDSFTARIGGTTYLVRTFWNNRGGQTLLQQFMELLDSEFRL